MKISAVPALPRYCSEMPETILIVPAGSFLGNAAFSLRREVFVFEQAVPEEEELDAFDLTATHFVAIERGDVVGTLRLIFEPEHVKIGRVVVHQHFRGRGVASRMIVAAMDHARGKGAQRFYLAAQADKTPFYEQFGFASVGDLFDDGSGIMHRAMKTYLSPAVMIGHRGALPPQAPTLDLGSFNNPAHGGAGFLSCVAGLANHDSWLLFT